MNQITDFFKNLFSSSDWPPRWHCGQWTAFNGWLYIISDLLIWSAYFTIPIVIIGYVSRKKHIQFTKLYFLFAAFILACGATHFLDAVAFWMPLYRLSALVRFITGLVSWVTVFYLVKYLPVIFSLRSQEALEAEIEERKKTELALKKSRRDYELLVGGVKDYAIFMLDTEGNVASWNSGSANIKGYTAEEIIGQPFDILYTEEEKQHGEPKRNLQIALQTGRYEATGWRVRKDKSVFWADIVLSALYDEDNRFYGYAKVTRDITEKRKAEERILFLATIASNIQDPFICTDNNGYITSWNEAAEWLLEWKSEEVVGKASTTILKIQYLHTTRELLVESFNKKKHWQGEVVYHTKSGRPINVLVTLSQLLDVEDNTTGTLLLVRDITERKKAEDAVNKLNEELEQKVKERTERLAASEIRFRMLIENSTDGIDLSDEFSNNIYRSPGAVKITGMLPKENQMGFTHPDDVETIITIQEQLLKNPGVSIPFQARFRHALGHYLWLEGTSTNLLHVEGVHAIITNFRDVTQRKELEVLLHKANVLARIGGWELDLVTGNVFWSDITKEIHETDYDYIPDLENGINFYKDGHGRDLIAQKVKEAKELCRSWDVELQIITAKNNERWVRCIGDTEFKDEKCIRIYGSFQDITERKTAEERIKNLNIELEEKVISRTEELRKINEELEAFSYSISHDLRAPLRSIIGFTSILEEDYISKLDAEAKRLTGVIKNNTTKMGNLIDDLLSFSRLGRQQIVKSRLHTDLMVKEIIGEIGTKNGGSMVNWIIAPLPDVTAHSTTMRQVWVNLLSNAVKYSGKQQQPSIKVGTVLGINETIFFVKDNGVGFNEAYSDKLFKVFQRLHGADFEGTGVGLAIVDRIMTKHGGRVWAESEPGKGACFFFSLPNESNDGIS